MLLRMNLRRAKRGAFLMEQGGGERAKRTEWVSLLVNVVICSHFAGVDSSRAFSSFSGAVHANVKTQKRKKRRTPKSAVTPTHGGFRRSNLDTVAGSNRRIILRERVVQGRSRLGSSARQCETSKKLKKGRITGSTTTPTYGGFIHSQNLTRWLVRPGVSFCAKVLFRDGGQKTPIKLFTQVKPQKTKKKENIESPPTPSQTSSTNQTWTRWLARFARSPHFNFSHETLSLLVDKLKSKEKPIVQCLINQRRKPAQ